MLKKLSCQNKAIPPHSVVMNKAFNEFKQMDAHEMEQFFLKCANYFLDNGEQLPNLEYTAIGKHLHGCYKLMLQRSGN